MARTPVGTIRQQDSRTALFAFILCQLEGVPLNEKCESFLARVGIRLGYNAVKKAGAVRMRSSSWDGRAAPAPATERDPPLRAWLLVEPEGFGLERAWIRFPGDGSHQADLIGRLKVTPGVQYVAELEEHGDVLCSLLFDGPRDRQRLRHVLREFSDRFIWSNVVTEDSTPEIGTWRALAVGAASQEHLD